MNSNMNNDSKRFKVYLSFSESRIPRWAHFITEHLKPAFKIFNIGYYDFREHEIVHHFNTPVVYEEINKNLANSDIFARFMDYNMPPHKIELRKNHSYMHDIIVNPFTRSYAIKPDYYDFEVDISFDRFGFTSPCNRFQIVPSDMALLPKDHITTVFYNESESEPNFASRLINEFIKGYQEQQNRKRSYLYWSEIINKLNDMEE